MNNFLVTAFKADLALLDWTPPYWNIACQAFCLPTGYEEEVICDNSG